LHASAVYTAAQFVIVADATRLVKGI